jgi:hypothetical protein
LTRVFAEVLLRLSQRDPETVVEASFSRTKEGASKAEEVGEEAEFSYSPDALEEKFAADATLTQYGALLADSLFPETIRKGLGDTFHFRRCLVVISNPNDLALREFPRSTSTPSSRSFTTASRRSA